MKNIIKIVIITLIVSIPSVVVARTIEVPENIRVDITGTTKEITLSVRGPYKITTLQTGEVLEEGRTFFDRKITPSEYGINFGKEEFKIYAIKITPKNKPSIYMGKRLYRGSLEIIKTKDGSLRAINVLPLDDYLKGVLYHEVSHRWPMEAIKAQAIVSRTFALYQAQHNSKNDYYLNADVSSQVYGGVYAEKYRTNKAVEQTKNEVLLYRGKLLPAFFHATCGGKTEDSSRLWKVKMKPLMGITCRYCKNSPHFSWQTEIGLPDIEKKLTEKGHKISGLNSIRIKGRDSSGRVVSLRLRGKSGSITITAKDFRHIIGARIIKSTNFTVKIKGKTAYFIGRGWGHGVGMCQWGAFAMAKKRYSAYQIIRHYYPGAEIITLK